MHALLSHTLPVPTPALSHLAHSLLLPFLHQHAKCAACHGPLEPPTISFLCLHSYHPACLAEEGEVSSGPPAQPKAGAPGGAAGKGPNHWQSAKVAARAAAAEAAKTPLERAREAAERATAAAAAAVAKAEALERETADRCGGGVG